MKRVYETLITDHLVKYNQAVFLSGARQVGKTTIAKYFLGRENTKYLNWDNVDDRMIILNGNKSIIEGIPVDAVLKQKPIVLFDEIHKYRHWRTLLKGFLDSYKEKLNVIVTGSTKLDVFNKGNESLMGRYFSYKIHQLSIAEIIRQSYSTTEISKPSKINNALIDSLLEYGGFPEPFLKQDKSFSNRWKRLRRQQLFNEDIRDLADIQEIAQLEVLAKIIEEQAGQLVNYSNLANKVKVSNQTISRWINVLESFYFCFTIRPWSKNVSRSLIKEPKIYVTDWTMVRDFGHKIENFVACHLIKAVDFWTDIGLGEYRLYFLRDKEKREVDFLVTKNEAPWILIEVKSSLKEPLSSNLLHFQKQLNVPHVLQVAKDFEYQDIDCFSLNEPKIVPLATFLSQLI